MSTSIKWLDFEFDEVGPFLQVGRNRGDSNSVRDDARQTSPSQSIQETGQENVLARMAGQSSLESQSTHKTVRKEAENRSGIRPEEGEIS